MPFETGMANFYRKNLTCVKGVVPKSGATPLYLLTNPLFIPLNPNGLSP
jgi:hypothetical protein